MLLFDFIIDRCLSRSINWRTHAEVKRILCFRIGADCPFESLDEGTIAVLTLDDSKGTNV